MADMQAHDQARYGSARVGRAFAVGFALNLTFVAVEIGFGIGARSLALLSDAGHNFGDVLGLLLAWWASRLARRIPTQRRTYGLRRSTVLAALANAILLLVAVGGIVLEALRRFGHPAPVVGGTVSMVAAAGVVINSATALLFMTDRKYDINVRGAFLHMVADAGVSLGVVLTGLAILRTGWLWLDPAASLVIAGVITVGTWGLLRESMELAMDAVPSGIDPTQVEAYLASLPAVQAVHDLHIWGMSTTETALTAHLVVREVPRNDALLGRAARELHDRFGIGHTTIQFEHEDAAQSCGQAPNEVV